MKSVLLISTGLFIGLIIGYMVYGSQVEKTYEDGSFIGCYIGGGCND